MIQSIREFFRNLPDKCCSTCGNVMNELADSYKNECEQCSDEHFYVIHTK